MSKLTDALNEQIGYEYNAHQQYVAMAVWYDSQTLPRLAAHFCRQAVEERNHGMILVQYMLDSRRVAVVPAVEAPKNDFADPVEPVRMALAQEEANTEAIKRLASHARDEDDLVAEQFIAWFLREQLEEESSMATLRATVERAATSNILLAEDFLAREKVGDEGRSPDTPPAAGGLL